MVLFRFIVFGFSGLFIQHHDRIGVGRYVDSLRSPGRQFPPDGGDAARLFGGVHRVEVARERNHAGLGNLPHPVHAQAHTQRLGTRIGDVEHDAPRLAAAGCRHVEHPISALDPAADRQGTVVCRSHLLRIIGGHPPHLGRGEENLPLIPAVVVLPVGLQGIGRAGGQHEVAHAAHGVLKRDVSQHALHVVAVAVLLEDGAFHRSGGIPPEEQLAHTAQFGLDLPAAGELVGPRMVVPIVGFAVQGTERPFHARRIGTPPRRGDQFHRRVFALDGVVQQVEALDIVVVFVGTIAVEEYLLVADADIFHAVRLGVAVLGTPAPPLRRHRAVQVLDHVGHILGRLFDIDRKGRREARLLAELQEILDAEAVGRPAVPVSVVGRPLVAVADHLLEAVARNVDHRTAVTQEGQPLVDHRLPDVTPQRQAAEAVFARGHQRHLIGLHPAGAVEVEGEAGIPVRGGGSQFERKFLPGRTDARDTLRGIFLRAVGTLQRHDHIARPAQVETPFERLPLAHGNAPAVQSGIGDADGSRPGDEFHALRAGAVIGVPHFVAVGSHGTARRKGVPLPADLHGRRRAEHEFARRTVGRNLHVTEPCLGIPRTQGDPAPGQHGIVVLGTEHASPVQENLQRAAVGLESQPVPLCGVARHGSIGDRREIVLMLAQHDLTDVGRKAYLVAVEIVGAVARLRNPGQQAGIVATAAAGEFQFGLDLARSHLQRVIDQLGARMSGTEQLVAGNLPLPFVGRAVVEKGVGHGLLETLAEDPLVVKASVNLVVDVFDAGPVKPGGDAALDFRRIDRDRGVRCAARTGGGHGGTQGREGNFFQGTVHMSGFLFYQFFLYLFERFVLGLGELYRKDKAAEGNKREKSEDIGAANRKEDREEPRQQRRPHPVGHAAQHLPLGTHRIGEDLGNDHPDRSAQRHGEEGDVAHQADKHVVTFEAFEPEPARHEHQRDEHPHGTYADELLPPHLVDEEHAQHGEREVGDADHDRLHHRPLAEDARHLEQARRIVEDGVDPRELVERRDEERQQDGDEIFFPEKPLARIARPGERGADLGHFGFDILARGAFEYTARLGVTAADKQPAGAFGHGHQQQAEGQCRDGLDAQHPLPVVGNPHDPVIGQVGDDDAQHDVELEEGHETPAPVRRGDLGDIHRPHDRRGADGQPAQEAEEHERIPVDDHGTAHGRDQVEPRDHFQRAQAPVAFGWAAADQGADDGADKRRGDREAVREVRERIDPLDRLFGTGDHGRVEAEQKAAERSDEGDIKHEAFNGCFHIRSD